MRRQMLVEFWLQAAGYGPQDRLLDVIPRTCSL